MPLILLQCSLCWLHVLKDSDEQTIFWPPSLLLSFVSLLSSQRACSLKAIGLLLADSTATVGWGKTFWRFSCIIFYKKAVTWKQKVEKLIQSCEIDRLAAGYKQAFDKIRSSIVKTFFWAKIRTYGPKKRIHSPVNIFNAKQVSNRFQDMRVSKVLLPPIKIRIFLQIGKILPKIGILGHCRLNICLFGPFWCYARPKDNGNEVPR